MSRSEICVYCGQPTGTVYDEHERCVQQAAQEAIADANRWVSAPPSQTLRDERATQPQS